MGAVSCRLPSKSPRRDLNPRPLPYQGSALPAELREPAHTNTPTGSRTPVAALRTQNPRPLDDGGLLVHTCGGNRTPNRRFWRPVLYQLSYARSGRTEHVENVAGLFGTPSASGQGQN